MNNDLGLLFLRLGMGGSMAFFHGWGKISQPENWGKIGAAMDQLGIGFAHPAWGFLAAFSEFACALLVMLGLYFRPATAMLAFTMAMAVVTHLNMDASSPVAGWKGASHALEYAIVWIALFMTGPGSHALVLKKKES